MLRNMFSVDFGVEGMWNEETLLDYAGDVFDGCSVENDVNLRVGGIMSVLVSLSKFVDSLDEILH
jgi:hypothetical protein